MREHPQITKYLVRHPVIGITSGKLPKGGYQKKKNCKILDICQISVTLPTLYPDMDIKKFGHIFYTLTYLPIKKIWTNLEKSWYSYKAFRLFETYYYRLSPRDIG